MSNPRRVGSPKTVSRYKNRQQWRRLLLVAISSGAMIATPQLAQAQLLPILEEVIGGVLNTTQTLLGDNTEFTAEDGLEISVENGIALSIQGGGALSFVDVDAALLQTNGSDFALDILGTGDLADPATPGSIRVEANTDIIGGGGLNVINNGTGSTILNLTGTVTGTQGDGLNVIVNIGGEGTPSGDQDDDVVVNVVDVTGNQHGIDILNDGNGDTHVTSTGTVTGTNGNGINAENGETAGDLNIDANIVNGGVNGINALNNGDGNTNITANGAVTGETGNGINAENGATAGDLIIQTEGVNGGVDGINASNQGTGNTQITANGTVTGTTGSGINAANGETAGDLIIQTEGVTGADDGINADNQGTGNTQITANGAVTGTAGSGINVANGETAGDLIIQTEGVSGGEDGINASNQGIGNTQITANGAITGTAGSGINVANSETAGDLIIQTEGVSGGEDGINASNQGIGNTQITANGDVTGTTGSGINAVNGVASADLIIQTEGVSGGEDGINALNNGTGNTQITANGDISGAAGSGINASNGATAGDLIIQTQGVTGTEDGINASNQGDGRTQITVAGAVTGTDGDGINATNGSNTGDLVVDVQEGAVASGSGYGVSTLNAGTGTTTINIDGVAHGGIAGIQANSSGPQPIEINVGGEVRHTSQATDALAIENTIGPVTINNNSLITGRVALGDYGNTFNNNGTWNVAGGTSYLGGGIDLLDNQAGGTILAANAEGPVTTTVAEVNTVIHSGSIVLQNQMAGGDTAYTGDVANFTNSGNGEFRSNGGRLYVDTDFENNTSDVLIVDNVSVGSGPTRVYINPINGTQITTEEGINVVQVTGTSADDAFVLGNSIGRGLYSYELGRGLSGQNGQNWYLREGDELRGEAPMAGALGVLASRTALATLPALHDRLREGDDTIDYFASRSGARLVSNAVILPEGEVPARKGVWGRVFGQNNEFSADGGTGGGYDASTWGAQAGIDLVASGSLAEGRTYGGVYLGYATSNGDALRGGTRLGRLGVNATSVGAYYTRYNSNGFYWDAVAQYSRISDAELKYLGDRSKSDGSGYLLSLEAGKQLNNESKYVTEVQGQLLYQRTSVDEMRLADSTRFDIGNLSGVTGRVGVRLSRNPNQGARMLPWIGANLWHSFSQEVRVSSLGDSVSTPADGTTGEVQLGLSLIPSKAGGWSAYLAGGYQFDVSGSDYSGWKGTLGVRKGW